ncbi:MAG: UxaA family hydrolase [bacterium]|jgi:altronate dehydratase small subunit
MPKKHDAILINEKDNVAVAIRELVAGEQAVVRGESTVTEIPVIQPIPFGHKFALKDIETGTKVLKYGAVIGKAIKDIKQGEHVHDHNIEGLRGKINGGKEGQ